MAFMMYSVDEAIDSKFIITKNISNQAKPGTLIHIMDASQTSNGISVDYRVTGTNQDFTVRFETLKQFCKWIQPDNFIARHYESLTNKDIVNYMKVSNHGFVSFCLPLIIIALAIIWPVCLLLLPSTLIGIIVGAVLSVAAVVGIILINKKQKSDAKMKIYSSVAGSKWGIKF